uniref:Uncharacterized protein n=1 Tax=Anguilla anguilla TaxID=7936 RepID=A0A0E9UCI1_ANGAN
MRPSVYPKVAAELQLTCQIF